MCVVAFGHALYVFHHQEPSQASFVGVYMVVLGFPWSVLLFTALHALGVFKSPGVGVVTFAMAICAALNALLLYKLGRSLEERIFSRKRD